MQVEEAREQGIEKGIEKGIEQGIEKGIEKGIEQGIEKGAYQKTIEVAKNLKDIGIPLAQIAKGTGLSIEEIERL